MPKSSVMKEEIMNNLDQPKQLEKLYRSNKSVFKKTFDLLYPEIQTNHTAQVWRERLHYESGELSWGIKNELPLVIALSLVAGLIAKFPEVSAIDPESYYPRNMAFVVFPALAVYFAWKQRLSVKKTLIVFGTLLAAVVYINLIPGKQNNDTDSDTFVLACLHMPVFLWMVLGFAFTGNDFRNTGRRLDFLRYNGDLTVITAVILIAGALLSAITIGLFHMIELNIEEFYFNNIVIWGLAACLIIGTYLVQSNPQLVKNVSPVIARVFAPLVLVTLVAYLLAIVNTGKSPFTDRDYLMIFNLVLIGVMAIVLFSVAETSHTSSGINNILLLVLCIVTIIVNTIALSAIVFRISEWGITPNRIAVCGANVLMLVNLMMVTYRLFKSLRNAEELNNVEKSIASFLPVYGAWTVIVVFVFPVLFGFK